MHYLSSQEYRTDSTAFASLAKAMRQAAQMAKEKPAMTVYEWAHKHRWLTAEGGGAGKFQLLRAPYQKEPLEKISDPLIRKVTLMWGIRLGKTQGVIENVIGYHIDYDPSSIMMVLPTDQLAQRWSKIHLKPMIRETPVLTRLMGTQRMHEPGAEILFKTFPGGYIVIGSATSANTFAMYTIRVACADEIDLYPVSAGHEGDPLQLLEGRTTTIADAKIILTGKPTIDGLSRIQKSFLESDQRHYYVPCPHCRHMQVLIFSPRSLFNKLGKGFLKYDKDNLSWVVYECENCRKDIEEKSKPLMMSHGQWRATNPKVPDHAGYQLSGLYSQLNLSWKQIVREWLIAQREQDYHQKQVFINGRLAETWQLTKTIEITEQQLAERIENYTELPDDIILLTAGVDVQGDRLEIVVKGWGLKEESWLVDKRIMWGSPDTPGAWSQLEAYIRVSQFKCADGRQLVIASTCIDSSAFSERVYAFAKRHRRRRVFATKGKEGWQRDIVGKVRKNEFGANFFIIGVDVAKQRVYQRLTIQRSKDDATTPGYMHMNQLCDDEYWKQLTSERIKVSKKRGFPVQVWELPAGRKNEMLDCEVLNLAAYTVLNAPMEQLGRRREEYRKTVSSLEQKTPGEKTTAAIQQSQQPTETRKRGGWMTSDRKGSWSTKI